MSLEGLKLAACTGEKEVCLCSQDAQEAPILLSECMVRLVGQIFREGNKHSSARESDSIFRNVIHVILKHIFKHIFNSNYVSLVFFQGSQRTVFLLRNINLLMEATDLFPIKTDIRIILQAITREHGLSRPRDPKLLSWAEITQISTFVGVT